MNEPRNAYLWPLDEGFIADPTMRRFYADKPQRDADYAATVEAIAKVPAEADALKAAFDVRWRQSALDISPWRIYELDEIWKAQRAAEVAAYQAEQQRRFIAAWRAENCHGIDAERDELLEIMPPVPGDTIETWMARLQVDEHGLVAAYIEQRNESRRKLMAAGFDPELFG